jgi:hypothetical protein
MPGIFDRPEGPLGFGTAASDAEILVSPAHPPSVIYYSFVMAARKSLKIDRVDVRILRSHYEERRSNRYCRYSSRQICEDSRHVQLVERSFLSIHSEAWFIIVLI